MDIIFLLVRVAEIKVVALIEITQHDIDRAQHKRRVSLGAYDFVGQTVIHHVGTHPNAFGVNASAKPIEVSWVKGQEIDSVLVGRIPVRI